MSTKVIYPGTFDPITIGHLDIIKRAQKIFKEVVVGISISKEKTPMFTLDERTQMMHLATEGIPGVSVKTFDTLLVDFAQKEGARIIIRGLRAVSDFEYELQLGFANRSLDPGIDTVSLMPSLEQAFVSSSIVRSVLKYKGDISHLVPPSVAAYIREIRCT
jgi:pantetheine-phosphate adenylyltransferase